MNIEKLVENAKVCCGDIETEDCSQYCIDPRDNRDGELRWCRQWLIHDLHTALSTLQTENEKLKDQLYDGEGTNLVEYWMQQAKIEENGHRNCQTENEKLRAELETVQGGMLLRGDEIIGRKTRKKPPHEGAAGIIESEKQ